MLVPKLGFDDRLACVVPVCRRLVFCVVRVLQKGFRVQYSVAAAVLYYLLPCFMCNVG